VRWKSFTVRKAVKWSKQGSYGQQQFSGETLNSQIIVMGKHVINL
jgi:hypothetical protein